MRIERIELDGFGRFAGEHWDLNEGMTIVLGANEAGKTTLLNAVRALLFGFESTREGRTWYPALAGGKRGGRLVLRLRDGERWTVDRHGERGGLGALAVEAPNGNRGGQDELNRLLGGADRDLFNNIFAFGLGELEALSSLSGEGVRSRIYGAGSGLGGTSVLDIERRLRGEQEAAYKPRGQEQALTKLLGQMELLRGRIAALEEQPAAYQAARTELDELRRRRAELRAARLAAAERREHLRRLLEAQEPAARLALLERELSDADPRLDALAPDAEPALDRLLATQHEAAAALATLDQSIAETERRRTAIAFDPLLLAEAPGIDALRDERVTQAKRHADERAAADAAARLDAELADLLRQVGGWSEERLLAVDDSLPAAEAMRDLEARLASTEAAAQRLDERLDAARRDLDAAAAQLSGGDADEIELARRAAALRELDELRVSEAALAERERLGAGGARPLSPLVIGLGAGLIVLLFGTLLGISLELQPAGTVAGALLGIGVGAWLALRSSAAPPPSDRAALKAQRVELLARAGLSADAGGAAIAAAADELAASRAGLRSATQQRARLDERRASLERMAAEATSARAARDAAAAAWRGWLPERGLADDLSPQGARQVVAAVAVARRLARDRDEQRSRVASIAQASAAYDARLDALLGRLGRALTDDADTRTSIVGALAAELLQAAQQQQRAHDLDAALAELRARREPMATSLAIAEADVVAHLERCAVADADELRRLAAAAGARQQTRQSVRELRATLAALAGSEEALPALLDEAVRADPAHLAAQREEVIAEVMRLEQQEAEALTGEGELRGEIGRLETAEELGTARQQLALVQARAEEEARRWAVRAVALALLAETRRRYERERQPQVVRDAERYFAAITDGRYPRIVAPPGEANVRVEPEIGAPRGTEELSRGTAEQLYLSLRFGLIEQFGRNAEPLPVVMDDILVNFDRERSARAARAIRELATRHQVLFFTCHPQTAELLDPDGVATVHLS